MRLRLYVTVELTNLADEQVQARSRRFSGRYVVPSFLLPESWDLYRDHTVRVEVDLNSCEQVFVHTELHLTFDFSRRPGRGRQQLGRIDYLQAFAGRGPPGSGTRDFIARQLLVLSEEDLWDEGYELEESEGGEAEV